MARSGAALPLSVPPQRGLHGRRAGRGAGVCSHRGVAAAQIHATGPKKSLRQRASGESYGALARPVRVIDNRAACLAECRAASPKKEIVSSAVSLIDV